MKSTIASLFSIAAAFFLLSLPVSAHHGTSTYDLSKTITLDGTVTGFEWENPHCLIHFDAKDASGKVAHWTLELASPYTMARKGWTKDSLKLGDQIAVDTHPARNGLPLGITSTAGYILKVVANGQPLPTQ